MQEHNSKNGVRDAREKLQSRPINNFAERNRCLFTVKISVGMKCIIILIDLG